MDKAYTAEAIQSLSVGEAIRMRPQLYFEQCFRDKHLDALPFEVLCHAFDAYFDGVCKQIDILVNKDSFTVSYDAGIDLQEGDDGLTKAEVIMTQIFACRNEKKHLAVGGAFCNLGIATINYAAERCELTTVCDGKKGYYIFENGITVSRHIDVTTDLSAATKILIQPNKRLFEGLHFTFDGISKRAEQLQAKLTGLNMIVCNNSKHD